MTFCKKNKYDILCIDDKKSQLVSDKIKHLLEETEKFLDQYNWEFRGHITLGIPGTHYLILY